MTDNDSLHGPKSSTDLRSKGAITGTADSSSAIAAALTDAKDSSAALPFGLGPDPHSSVVIDIPAGVWTVTQVNAMIGSEGMTAKSVGLKIRGAGLGLTSIVFNPASGAALNVNDYWLGISFEGIDFYTTVAGCTFMLSNTKHNAQRYSFSHCSFSNFKYVIDLQGNNNNSEFLFLYCHSTGIGSKESDPTAGAFFRVGATNTSDQFLNYWFYGCTHWTTAAPYIDAALGGSFHIFGLDCSDWGSALTKSGYLFTLRGSSHSYGVNSFEAHGVRVEGKNDNCGLLYSEWPMGAVTFRNVDFTSQINNYTYSNLCTFHTTAYTTTAYLFQGCRLPGPVTVNFDTEVWRAVPVIKFDGCEFLKQPSPSSVVNYVSRAEGINSAITPHVVFANCTNDGTRRSALEPSGYAVWDATIGATTQTGEVTRREIHCRQNYHTDTVSVVLPVGALITDFEVMSPNGAITQTSHPLTWTWETSETTPVTIGTVSVSTNPSLGFRQSTILAIPFRCATTAQATVKMTTSGLTQRNDQAIISIKGYW